MNIFVLDDMMERHELIEKFLSREHTLFHCFDVKEGLDTIANFQGTFGLALLDHDLQDFVQEGNKKVERDGMTFVRSMLQDIPEEKHPASFIIHSYNMQRALVMCEALVGFGKFARCITFSGDMLKRLQEELKPQ